MDSFFKGLRNLTGISLALLGLFSGVCTKANAQDNTSSLLVKTNYYGRVFESFRKDAYLIKADKLERMVYSEQDIEKLFVEGKTKMIKDGTSLSERGCFKFENLKVGRYSLEIGFYKREHLTTNAWKYEQLINILPNSNQIIEAELKPKGGYDSDLYSSYEKAKFFLKNKEYKIVKELQIPDIVVGQTENYENFINNKKVSLSLSFPDNISEVKSLIKREKKKGFKKGMEDLINKEAFIVRFQYGNKVINKTYRYNELKNNLLRYYLDKELQHASGCDTLNIDDIYFVNNFVISLRLFENPDANERLFNQNEISLIYPKILQRETRGIKIKIFEDGWIQIRN